MREFTDEQIEELKKITVSTENLYSEFAARDVDAVRLHKSTRRTELEFIRSQYAIDADSIINCRFYNRGSDKTQVFSFYKNDEITRRTAHVQLVSRIARKIGKALRLNLDLIEAIAIGHDIGHTPFGHAGEEILSRLYLEHAGKYFNHNVHSVRVLNMIMHNNLTVQTLDGILCHCGEEVNEKYEPSALPSARDFYKTFDECYSDGGAVKRLRPGTLEGCVVRLSDMIAYLGKDRADAKYTLHMDIEFDESAIGSSNKEIIDNVTRDVIAGSMGKPYLSLSEDVYKALVACKKENNDKIYKRRELREPYERIIAPMTEKMYKRFVCDLKHENTDSVIYKHYLNDFIIKENYFDKNIYKTADGDGEYIMANSPEDIAADFIASMTDDYFLDAFSRIFPDDALNKEVSYVGYFDGF